jgi:hypothetical protein
MTLYAGDRSPKAYQVDLSAIEDVDFVQVETFELRVRRPDGTKTTWTAEVVGGSLTASAVSVIHELAADGSDLPKAGAYDFFVYMYMTGGGELQSDPFTEYVQDPYGTRV